ncbi:MAG: dTMP kinase [Sphaerochaeta sp.]|uniref:dTMP kinase n=1 Tax=Sphaerochaeta sp. TaxID=1972642 RepID=UPI001DEF682A|nr:dTMP kinase [uncultured Sphaerochaeta sp.]MDD3929054.1 dTMP kinase [Sphaerochaeta sp.]NCC89033.1 dTMP kinase [Spirochaetia bacterium]
MPSVLTNFVVFEGLDGAGTTTQMQLLAEYCDKSDRPCRPTFEPTDKPIGRLVRSVLQKQLVTTPLALAMLYAADREDHLYNPVNGLVHDLEKGKLVISDRYLYSSLAYQGVECEYDKIASLNEFPAPEYVFFIDTPVDECLRRISGRGNETELFEKHEFLERVKENYEKIFSSLPQEVHLVRIDGLLGKEEIAAQIQNVLFSK